MNDFIIKKTAVSKTYCKLSNVNADLNAGSKKTRLQFSLKSNIYTKNTADVYIEVIGDNFFDSVKSFFLSKMDRKFVKISHGNNIIYINVNSLSKRIGINKEEIYSSSKDQKALILLIKKKKEEYHEIEKKADDFFNYIIKDKYIEKVNEITTGDGKSISKKSLRKMIGIAAFCFKEENNEVAYSLKNGNVLLLKKQDASKWPLMILFTQQILGDGISGRVQVVHELSMGRVSVAKIAHSLSSEEDIKNENEILNLINNNKSTSGIQKQPYFLFNFRLKNEKYCGYIAPKYDCNLTSVKQKLTKNEKTECARQLLKGLSKLEKKKICHGDIKSDNCLFKKNINDSIECVIADFGGANSMLKSVKWPKYSTDAYECSNDYLEYLSLCRQHESEKLDGKRNVISNNAKTVALKSDVYAMSFVIEDLLRSFDKDKQKSKEIKILIDNMRCISWMKRIKASDALLEFNNIFK